jgi:hypothetical protein
MGYVGEVEMTYRLFRNFCWEAFTRRSVTLFATFLVGLVVVAVTASAPALRFGALFAALVAYPTHEWRIWRQWCRIRHLAATPWHYEIGPTVSIITPESRVDLALSSVASARSTRSAWMLTTRSSRARVAMAIPRAAFPPGEAREIDALLAQTRLRPRVPD